MESTTTRATLNDAFIQTFGSLAIRVEQYQLAVMDQSTDYQGGNFKTMRFENGAACRVLDSAREFEVVGLGNYYSGRMSAEALSIATHLMATNHLMWKVHESGSQQQLELLHDQFYLARNVALEHPEATEIMGFID